MKYTYNIAELYATAFGLGSIRQYRTNPPAVSGSQVKYSDMVIPLDSKPKVNKSYLDTPIIMPVSFETVSWKYRENGVVKSADFGGCQLPPTTLISVSRAKRIIKTEVAGRDGTVKELISQDDWKVQIKGFVINEDHPYEYPEDEVAKIKELSDVPVSITIINDLCRYMGIHKVVLESIDLPAIEGFPGVQPFQIECSSDEPFELVQKLNL